MRLPQVNIAPVAHNLIVILIPKCNCVTPFLNYRPSDILASVLYGARTVARCTSDANPCGGKDPSGPWATRGWPYCSIPARYAQLAGAAVLLAPLHVRPFADSIWTTETQGNPRTGSNARRPTVVHDLIVSTLSAGPVGFSDLINHTNSSLLAMATRADGTILKPAATALRIDRFYKPSPFGSPVFGSEVWTAVTGPAGSADSANDVRANSLALLGEKGPFNHSRDIWWWSILSTQVDGNLPSGAPLHLAELWPKPPESTILLVFKPQSTSHAGGNYPGPGPPCRNGSLASSCLFLWDASTPLSIGTSGAPGPNSNINPKQNFSLLAAAPVLSSGWVLLGDLRKLVPCSPQRFVAASTAPAPRDTDFTRDNELAFTVIGSPAEEVPVTIVTPPREKGRSALEGSVIVLNLTIGVSGTVKVVCAKRMCRWTR